MMISIAIHGCSGHMGQVVARLVQSSEDLTIACGIDVRKPAQDPGFPVFSSFSVSTPCLFRYCSVSENSG